MGDTKTKNTNKSAKAKAVGSNGNNKKRKSPFRIKRGCIVAWRMNQVFQQQQVWTTMAMQQQQQAVQFGDDYDIVWTRPWRSDNLIGKRIRCFVQKQMTEGEVIVATPQNNNNDDDTVSIQLLVQESDRHRALAIPHEGPSSLEARIRGLDKLTIATTLSWHDPDWVIQRLVPKRLYQHTGPPPVIVNNDTNNNNKSINNNNDGDKKNSTKKTRKRKKPVTRFVGSKYDKEETQIKNWRWLCSKFHDTVEQPDLTCQLAAGWIGRVLSMNMSCANTLAQLTIERLFCVDNVYYSDAQKVVLHIPVEQVVIVAKSAPSPPALCYSRVYNLFLPDGVNGREAIENHDYCEHCRKHASLFATPMTQPHRYCNECQATDLHEQFCRQLEQNPKHPKAIEFGLPRDLLDNKPVPSLKPITKQNPNPKPKQVVRARSPKTAPKTKRPAPEVPVVVAEDYSVFKPTCARTTVYDRKRRRRMVVDPTPKLEQRRNVREERIKHDRASRANQRRLKRQIKFNYLVNRENQIRFDRSKIHAWGVFADVFISADEMIVEYRGELIGNTVAEQREKEYEAAKIGSDYMFRIDKELVCDATRIGCIARFINHCCDPNCYTKIITLDGTKRIGIYAKKDIEIGDELCYDYKFPLEYDETKRIPCHCGAKECRGFMNWDKRYIVEPEETMDTTESAKEPAKQAPPALLASKPPAQDC